MENDCELCGGYGGHWVSVLGADHIGWTQPPENFDDGVGYAACVCMYDSTIKLTKDNTQDAS